MIDYWEGGGIDITFREPVNLSEFSHDLGVSLSQQNLAKQVTHIEIKEVFHTGEHTDVHAHLQLQDGRSLYHSVRSWC